VTGNAVTQTRDIFALLKQLLRWSLRLGDIVEGGGRFPGDEPCEAASDKHDDQKKNQKKFPQGCLTSLLEGFVFGYSGASRD
jgi:hypothetical protein